MNPDSWNKQEWIKDVLSKSGTDILEIKEEKTKELCKMVYYPSLPLIMKSETKQQQLCSQLSSETQIYQNIQQQQIHHPHPGSASSISSSSGSAKLLIPSSQSFLHNIKIEPQQAQTIQAEQQGSNSNSTSSSISNQHNARNKVQFKCEQCNMIFGSKSAHTSHMKSHVKQDNNFPASIAPVMTGSSQVTTTTGTDPYQCNACQKTFAVPARLIRHYRTHTGERPFECEFCHKAFSVKENLQVHRRIHTKERPYKCDVCGRAFEHSGKLHRHMRIHTGERPHKCSVCSKTFIQSGQLVIHMRTHTGEKPYKCPVEGCGKGFTCSKQLKVHSRTHTGEKPYHCDICFRDFGYNHVLKLHRVQHYGSKCYKCTICDETFKSKKEMEAHIKGHANEIPDDDDEQSQQSQKSQNIKQETPSRFKRERESILETEKCHESTTTSSTATTSSMEVTVEGGSEANSESGEESMYSGMYQRFEQSGVSFSLQPRPTLGSINPALLAAASIASRRVEESNKLRLDEMSSTSSSSPPPPPPPAHANKSLDTASESREYFKQSPTAQEQSSTSPFPYSSLDAIRQRAYFTPAPVAEFRPSLRSANDIVRQVEAAIAGAEPLLTPSRSSSTESPDRSSSPESDSMMMADRDVMTLPLRKRKLYLKDNQSNDVSPVMRMNSVIQFAKAS